MGIQQKLHTKLVQKLILTPSLQQAIKLLPMSTLELSDLLNQEMVENPMLEEVPTEDRGVRCICDTCARGLASGVAPNQAMQRTSVKQDMEQAAGRVLRKLRVER